MHTTEQIGALIYTLAHVAKNKKGDMPMSEFLQGDARTQFYKLARGSNIGPVTVASVEKCVPELRGCIAPSRNGRPTLTAKGEKLYKKLESTGKLLGPKPRRGTTPAPVSKAPTPKATKETTSTPGAFGFCGQALTLIQDKAAPQWVELLETAARDGYEPREVVSYLKSALEVAHGLH